MKGEIECKGIAFLPNSLNKTHLFFKKNAHELIVQINFFDNFATQNKPYSVL